MKLKYTVPSPRHSPFTLLTLHVFDTVFVVAIYSVVYNNQCSVIFLVLIHVEMKSQSGNVFTGTEGDRVEIYCNYPDGYQYVSHYFCRHPCGYSDVLIRTKKAGKVTSEGRYSILNTVSAQSLSVTIRNLRLGDSGVYYCGVEKWGKDRLSKVEVTVRKGKCEYNCLLLFCIFM